MSDSELGARFRYGGEHELEEVINLYGEKLLRYITAILCDYQEAEDIVQEVFVSAYQHRTSFDGKNLSAWLYRIAHNLSMNHLKRRKLFCFSEIREDVSLDTRDTGFSNETLLAMQRLKPKERAVLYGRIMEEKSYDELSHISGKSPVAIRKQYERAKKKLAEYLKAEDPLRFGKEQNNEYT